MALLSSSASPAFADDDSTQLREELAAQKRALEALEARVKEHEEQTAKVRKEHRRTTVWAFAQFDWTAFRESSEDEVTPAGEPLNRDRFMLRRARIRVAHDEIGRAHV